MSASASDDSAWRRPADSPSAGSAPAASTPADPSPPTAGRPKRPGAFRVASPDEDPAVWGRPAGMTGPVQAGQHGGDPSAGDRPRSGGDRPADASASQTGFLAYSGPPPSNPPPANWRPPLVTDPPAAGQLPAQDHERLDVEEQAARTLTNGIGLVVGAILLVLLFVLCARAVF